MNMMLNPKITQMISSNKLKRVNLGKRHDDEMTESDSDEEKCFSICWPNSDSTFFERISKMNPNERYPVNNPIVTVYALDRKEALKKAIKIFLRLNNCDLNDGFYLNLKKSKEIDGIEQIISIESLIKVLKEKSAVTEFDHGDVWISYQ